MMRVFIAMKMDYPISSIFNAHPHVGNPWRPLDSHYINGYSIRFGHCSLWCAERHHFWRQGKYHFPDRMSIYCCFPWYFSMTYYDSVDFFFRFFFLQNFTFNEYEVIYSRTGLTLIIILIAQFNFIVRILIIFVVVGCLLRCTHFSVNNIF